MSKRQPTFSCNSCVSDGDTNTGISSVHPTQLHSTRLQWFERCRALSRHSSTGHSRVKTSRNRPSHSDKRRRRHRRHRPFQRIIKYHNKQHCATRSGRNRRRRRRLRRRPHQQRASGRTDVTTSPPPTTTMMSPLLSVVSYLCRRWVVRSLGRWVVGSFGRSSFVVRRSSFVVPSFRRSVVQSFVVVVVVVAVLEIVVVVSVAWCR